MEHGRDGARLIRQKDRERTQRPDRGDERDTDAFRKLRHAGTVADEMNQGYGPPPGYYPPSPYGAPPPYGGPPPMMMQSQQPSPRTSSVAILSLVTGIVALVCGIGSWVCCFLVFLAAPLSFVCSAVAIPTGGVAMSQIKKSGGALGGNGMAIAGLTCGVIALVPTLLWVVFVGWSMITSP